MPVAPTYPGVYIEEVPSGVRTIVGVATSIAAFIGWAPQGPTDRAGRVLSWADFERMYGGLHADSLLGYSVYHFFTNGGQEAVIVRIAASDAAKASVTVGSLVLTATGEGAWANTYGVRIRQRSDDPARFGLSVGRFPSPTPQNPSPPFDELESFSNLSMDPKDSRFAKEVINARSRLLTAEAPDEPGDAPPDTPDPVRLSGGEDGAVLKPNTSDFRNAVSPPTGEGGLARLDRVELFNLLCVPGEATPDFLGQLAGFCAGRRAFLIADCDQEETLDSAPQKPAQIGGAPRNAATYFPWVFAADALQENQPSDFPPCGFIAGLYARTDVARGVWKAPAGIEAGIVGALRPKVPLTDLENGKLNIHAMNCIRSFPVYGTVCWGARTLDGDDERGSEWKYVPIRRLALYIEESLFRGTKWVVFEPNDEPLWAQIRLNVGAFMQTLFRQGAFQGASPREAYFVKCDKSTNPQNDIDRGIVNIIVGFAPLKPAEFVIIKIQQIPGDIQV